MMKWTLIVLCLVSGYSVAFAQQDQDWKTLNQAIHVVRNWLGDPKAVVEFKYKIDYSIDLFGPENTYRFSCDVYNVSVDINTMKVDSWNIRSQIYVQNAQITLPMLKEEQVRKIALNYVKQHFPYWNEFPNWEITSIYKLSISNLDKTKKAYEYKIQFQPYFFNEAGKKIPMLPVLCGVGIDPYTGDVTGFGYSYMPMTLTKLEPNFSPQEAKEKIEKAFLNLGAAQAVAVMSSSGDPYYFMPDGLVIGATQTSGLRLAYAFDYVVTVGSSGNEDEFGDAEYPALWRAAIDAHTGELFYREYYSGAAGEKEKKSLLQGSIHRQERTFPLAELLTIVVIIGCFLILILTAKRQLTRLNSAKQ